MSRYLSQKSRPDRPPNPTTYIKEGAVLVSPEDLAGLRKLLPEVSAKAARITDSERLRRRIDLLTLFFRESQSQGGTTERQEIAFVLFYFLKGYDIIPDSIPKIGLLDDALLVETALHRNQEALRSHWAARQRVFPSDY
ncbi:MAG: YkvA family protein [Lacunisphaera sp.]|nr:YkvA family protein [Lacunisphaera sp.]